MSDKDWLQNLKVGDTVIEDRGYGGKSICTISRLMNTQIVIKDSKGFESKYRRKDGYAVGADRWSRDVLREATPEALTKFEEERYRAVFQNKLSHLSWADVPLEKIKQIRELVEPHIRKEK